MSAEIVHATWHDGRIFLARVDPVYGVAIVIRPEQIITAEIERPSGQAGPKQENYANRQFEFTTIASHKTIATSE